MTNQPVSDQLRLISASTVFDGQGTITPNGGVVVRRNQILAAGDRQDLLRQYPAASQDAEHFEHCTLLPGLIDMHNHLIMPGTGVQVAEQSQLPYESLLLVAANNARTSLQAGVTTLVDLGSKGSLAFRLREALERKIVKGSRLILVGRAITISGGHCWMWGGEADGEDGVRRAVRDLCKEGADLIKVMTTGGGTPGTDPRRPAYSLRELRALADEAHARGRKVLGHCTATKGIEMALDAGLDILVHCFFGEPDGSTHFSAEIARRILDQGAAVNPTLQVHRAMKTAPLESLTEQRRAQLKILVAQYPELQQNFLQMVQMGIPILCGSDCGWGWSRFGETCLELDAMVEAGMSPQEALVSATSRAAEWLGWGDRIGSLQPGKRADLLVVEGNPLNDVMALKKVRKVWLEGEEVA